MTNFSLRVIAPLGGLQERLFPATLGLLRAEAPFLLVAGLYVGLSPHLLRALGHESTRAHGWFVREAAFQVVLIAGVFALLARWLYRLRVRSSPHPLRLFSVERLVGIGLGVGLLPPLMNTFIHWKAAIPAFQPFGPWDASFVRWDRALHGGVDPWVWAHQILPSSAAPVLDWLYFPGWPLALLFTVAGLAWSDDVQLRRQFFLTYALTWIVLGTGAAMIFASVGPCFYGLVLTGPDPFVPLMERLVSMAPRTVEIQRELWAPIAAGEPMRGVGVSAMPSLHVGGSVLIAHVGWRLHWFLGGIATLFAVVIQFGSVYLGWHYALDGYASVVAVSLLWWVAGRITATLATR